MTVDAIAEHVEPPACLVDQATGHTVPAQLDDAGRLCFWSDALQPGAARTYRLDRVQTPAVQRVSVEQSGSDQVAVKIDGQLFTKYHYGSKWVRPFLYPLIGPAGESVTRHYPIRSDVPDEQQDHPHHKSCFVSWGDINGVDHWSEMPGHGSQRHVELAVCASGPVFGRIEAVNEWRDPTGIRQLTERRAMRFYHGTEGLRMFDLDVTFEMTDGDVKFGDTKEGGICAVRVASSMAGQRGGVIRNAAGGVGEAQTWGKPAAWCGYSGAVAGKTVGIAILDAPSNFRHPVTWHVRDYGLMGANPFGLSYFTGDKNNDGSRTWPGRRSVRFSYRVLVHGGDTETAGVAGHWLNFAQPLSTRPV